MVPQPELHHRSHRRLLTEVSLDGVVRQDLAAIVTPSFRPAAQLAHVMDLARSLGCPVMVLCSGAARGVEVIARAEGIGVRAWAVDVPTERPPLVDDFDTTKILWKVLGADQRDIGLKRTSPC